MIRILSDSTCDLSEELLQRYHVKTIPLNVVLDGKSYEDGRDITPDEIFAWAEEHKGAPKTAACAPGRIKETFDRYLQKGDEIICFAISSSMSSTCDVMRAVARETGKEDRISIIDSRSLSTGIGLMVIEAAEMAAKGYARQEIVAVMEGMKKRISASFVVDTLSYLHRGGRCSGVSALLGTTFRIHPRIDVLEGVMYPEKKYRGKMHKVVANYVQDQYEDLMQADRRRIFITHSGCDQKMLDAALEYLRNMNRFEEIFVTRTGGTVSCHCGPGTLGVLYVKNK